jgi:hypothetical protein
MVSARAAARTRTHRIRFLTGGSDAMGGGAWINDGQRHGGSRHVRVTVGSRLPELNPAEEGARATLARVDDA